MAKVWTCAKCYQGFPCDFVPLCPNCRPVAGTAGVSGPVCEIKVDEPTTGLDYGQAVALGKKVARDSDDWSHHRRKWGRDYGIHIEGRRIIATTTGRKIRWDAVLTNRDITATDWRIVPDEETAENAKRRKAR